MNLFDRSERRPTMDMIIKRAARTSLAALATIAVLGIGTLAVSTGGCKDKAPAPAMESHEEVYSCPMHPEVRQSEPGKCPECGMDLVLEEHSH
jgi:hypothetical protein